MKLSYLLMGSVEIIFAISFAVVTLMVGFKALSIFTGEYDDEKEIKENNISVGIISGVFLLCIGLILKTASGPALSTLENTIFTKDFTVTGLFIGLGLMILQLGIASVVAILSLIFTIFLTTKVSPFKNLKALMNNNIAISCIISAVMLVTVLMINTPLLLLLKGLIPQNKF